MIYHGFRRIALAHSLLPPAPDRPPASWPGMTMPSHADAPDPDEPGECDVQERSPHRT
jgi:hypothetical protein